MNRLKLLRKNAGKSQAEIGKIIGMTSQNYGRYENDTQGIPIDVLKKLSEYYNVSIDYILGIDNPNKNADFSDFIEICNLMNIDIKDFNSLSKDKKTMLLAAFKAGIEADKK